MKPSRLLERFWSIYLLGELGLLRVVRGFFRGVLILLGLAVFLVALIAIVLAVLFRDPDFTAQAATWLSPLALLVIAFWVIARAIRAFFR